MMGAEVKAQGTHTFSTEPESERERGVGQEKTETCRETRESYYLSGGKFSLRKKVINRSKLEGD